MEKSEQRDGIFANMRVNVHRDITAGTAEFGKSRDGNGDVVTDAGGFHDGLVRMFGDETAAKMSNHGRRTIVPEHSEMDDYAAWRSIVFCTTTEYACITSSFPTLS